MQEAYNLIQAFNIFIHEVYPPERIKTDVNEFLHEHFVEGMTEHFIRVSENSTGEFEIVNNRINTEFPVFYFKPKNDLTFQNTEKYNRLLAFISSVLPIDASKSKEIIVNVDERFQTYDFSIWYSDILINEYSEERKIEEYYRIMSSKYENDIYRSIVECSNAEIEKLNNSLETLRFYENELIYLKTELKSENNKNYLDIFINSYSNLYKRLNNQYPFLNIGFVTNSEIIINEKLKWNGNPNLFWALFSFLVENKLIYIKNPNRKELKIISEILYQLFDVYEDKKDKKIFTKNTYYQHLKFKSDKQDMNYDVSNIKDALIKALKPYIY